MVDPQLATLEVTHAVLGEMAFIHQSGQGFANPKLAFCPIILTGPERSLRVIGLSHNKYSLPDRRLLKLNLTALVTSRYHLVCLCLHVSCFPVSACTVPSAESQQTHQELFCSRFLFL